MAGFSWVRRDGTNKAFLELAITSFESDTTHKINILQGFATLRKRLADHTVQKK